MSKKPETIIITGASRGIGEAATRRFCAEGFRVVGIARSIKALNALQAELGPTFVPQIADLSDLEMAENVISSLLKDRKLAISGVVLNAGVSTGKPFLNSSLASQTQEMNLNYHSPSIFLQHALKRFARLSKGKIIVVSSLTALVPFPNNSSYAASKAAFYHLLRSVRLESISNQIEISAVLPGLTDTQMSSSFDSALLPRATPDEVADAIYSCWLKPQFPKIVGRLNRVAETMNRLQPGVFDQIAASLSRWLPQHEN